jgi:hypothetical protein
VQKKAHALVTTDTPEKGLGRKSGIPSDLPVEAEQVFNHLHTRRNSFGDTGSDA